MAAALVVAGLLSSNSATAAEKPESSRPTHAIRGVVKAIGSSYVVITAGSGKKTREMTIVLTPSTQVEGDPSIGTTVSIRYRLDHRTAVATAMAAGDETAPLAASPAIR